MSSEQLEKFSLFLMYLNQVSTVVPMVVVWRRQKRFSPAVKLLSYYVYLSIFCSFGSSILYPAVFATNYWFLAGFNFGKILLFGAVYYRVLESAPLRQAVFATTMAAAVVIMAVFGYDTYTGVTCARLSQCAVLAGFAMLYLEQTLSRPADWRAGHDPVWLLSIGQLIYSAGTAAAFSFDYFSVTAHDQVPKRLIFTTLGLVFNGFLTLAFQRAKRKDAEVEAALPTPAAQLASF